MPTSSIFSKFVIKDDETMERFLKGNDPKSRKTPKIDIRKKNRRRQESFRYLLI